MKYRRNYTRLPLIIGLLLVLLMAIPAWGQGIKERMKARVPAIITLKNSGIVGEGYDGYLRFVGAKRDQQNVVQAENADRKIVYESVAKKQSTTAALVGKRRALQLAKIAASGHYLQKPDGTWYKK